MGACVGHGAFGQQLGGLTVPGLPPRAVFYEAKTLAL